MENKILEFVKEFNTELEKYSTYNHLQYKNDGTIESISLPEICVFDDQNDFSRFAPQNSVANLVLALENVLKISKKALYKHVKNFVEDLIKDNNIPRYKLLSKGKNVWWLIVGEDEEDFIWINDFENLFPGCKLRIVGDEKFNLSLPKSLEIGMYCVTKDGEIVKITSDYMPKYPYECFERMATYYEIKEYETKTR